MSTFITGGHYTADENIIFGEGFAEDGTVELVRMDLVNNGPFADVDSYTVLEKGFAPCYVTLYGEDVFFIHFEDGGIYKVPKDGGTPELVVSDAAEYLQIRDGSLYYCDKNYTFCRADLDGGNVTTVIDKEVYYPYFVNDEWILYQDDADDETLHLFHPESGNDIGFTWIPTYSPVIYGTDLYCTVSSNGDRVMAKVDMNYTPDSMDNFGIEYSEEPVSSDITISAEGDLYFGRKYGLSIDRWKDAENEIGNYDLIYRYLGENYEIHWEYDDQGLIGGIYLTRTETDAGQSLPRFD